MVISFTGHRPEKLTPQKIEIADKGIYDFIQSHKVDHALIGMCIGIDLRAAAVCWDCGIPYTACVPFIGQDKFWNYQQRSEYKFFLNAAKEIVYVSDGGFANWKYHARNKYMVDNSDTLVACWNGDQEGGTFSTIKYAKKTRKPIHYILL